MPSQGHAKRNGVANYSDMAQGCSVFRPERTRVINLSLGGYSASSALHTAIQAAAGTYGAVIVAGAGNDSLSTPFYPAAYPEVLSVAGTGQTDAKADLSNFGTWVECRGSGSGDHHHVHGRGLRRSGRHLLRCALCGRHRRASAQPQTRGWSADMTRAQVNHTVDNIDSLTRLRGTARQRAGQCRSGCQDHSRALACSQGYTIDGVANGRPEPGSTVDLNVTLYNDWADATSVQATLSSSDPYVTLSSTPVHPRHHLPPYTGGTNTTAFRFFRRNLWPRYA